MSEPAYRAVLRVMLTDPSADWYGCDLVEATKRPTRTIYGTLEQMIEAGWIENHGRSLSRYRLTGLGHRRATERVS